MGQHTSKLKAVTAEIKAIIEKNGMGGALMLHLPGEQEFLFVIDPPYSCTKLEHFPNGSTGLRIRSKLADYKGDKAMQELFLNNTVNMLVHMRDFGENARVNASNILYAIAPSVGITEGPRKYILHDPNKKY